MKYTISGIRKKQIPKRDGGTWTKIEIKTLETQDKILELGFGFSKQQKENIKIGDKFQGFLENRQWVGQNGTMTTPTLCAITAEYVYTLLLKKYPDIEQSTNTSNENDWDNNQFESKEVTGAEDFGNVKESDAFNTEPGF